jgi:type I pantothenate kinase
VTTERLLGVITARLRADRPIIVALDGSVAAGKSTLAQSLATGLREAGVAATVISADGFLLPLARMNAERAVGRKGFPDSFDRSGMAAFLKSVKAGAAPDAPAYDHAHYDVSPDVRQTTLGAAVVIFEGVNVLGSDLADLYDLSIYLDADERDLERWFVRRFVGAPFNPPRTLALAPWRPVNGDPADWAAAVWSAVNLPNLVYNIASGREHADVVIRKDPDHRLAIEA